MSMTHCDHCGEPWLGHPSACSPAGTRMTTLPLADVDLLRATVKSLRATNDRLRTALHQVLSASCVEEAKRFAE